MAKLTKQEEYVAKMYFSYFGKAADADTIKAYGFKENGKPEKASVILRNIIDDSDYEKIGLSTEEFVNNAFQNLFGRNATTKEMSKYYKVVDAGKDLPINSIVKSAAKTDKAVYNNKMAVAVKYAELDGKGDLDLSKISKGNLIDLNFLNTVTKAADLQAKVAALPDNSGIPSSFDGKPFVLTASVDTGKDFIGTDKNDQFLASDVTVGATATQTWSVFDSIDGGKGIDGLTIVSAAAVDTTQFENNTMKSIEIVDINAGTNNDITLDTTQAGKVAENFKAVTGLNLTTSGTGTINVTGGKNIVAKAGAAIEIGEDTDATTAATIEKVTIDGLATNSTIGSGTVVAKGSVDALKELTVKNSAAVATAGNKLTVTTAVETLKVNLDNNAASDPTAATPTFASNVILTDAKLKTLNVDASGKDSSVDFDTTSTVLETINISGNAKLTLETGSTVAASTSGVKEINVTNTKGVVIVDALGINTKFTGGAGADSVVLGATTKAIAMGAGDDTVTYGGALGTGGSVDAGAGKDTIKMTVAQVNAITDNKFNTTFSNFEVLEISGAAATAITAINTKKFNNVSQVTVAADLGNFASTIDNLVEGGTVKFTATQTGATHNLTVKILDADLSTANVLNLEVAATGSRDVKTVTADHVETININSDDTATTPTGITHTLILSAADATSIVVKGDAGLDLTSSTAAKVTNFDASASTGDVTFTSTNITVGAVTIKGGAGDDALTGTAQANDTIIGGKGADTITYTGGKDSFTGGEGNDIFVVGAKGTTVDSVYLTIQDLSKGDEIDVSAITTVASTVTPLGDKVAVGSGATFSQALDAAASTNVAAAAPAVLKWFQFESNTYLVVDNSSNTTYLDGADSVIKITGLVDLSASTVSAADLITII